MTAFIRLQQLEDARHVINVAIAGAGLIGRGMVFQIDRTPALRTAVIINRTVEHGVGAFVQAGRSRHEIVVSDCPSRVQEALGRGAPVVTTRPQLLRELTGIDVVVEVTGAVEYGAVVAVHAIEGGMHVVMMNAETDATVGCALKHRADRAGVVYTNTDGDQPGVLKRLCNHVNGLGFEIVCAINCKGFLDVHATPTTIREWAERQKTSLSMTTAFTDGTKMNIENAVLANATGLLPEVRGMRGVRTTLADALTDCTAALEGRGAVDYTLGGDFRGGVLVIGHAEDPVMIQPYMEYLKMGPGPAYLFYRPYHLCHFETPLSIAEAVLDHVPTIAPRGRPVVEVITIAKRDLAPGDTLDGIGGYTIYGQIDRVKRAGGLLPIGLAAGAKVTRRVPQDEPIPLGAVELDASSLLLHLRREQDALDEESGKSWRATA